MDEQPSLTSTSNGLRVVVWMSVILGVTALVLRMMGRVLWCECGNVVPWAWDINTPHNSQHLIDPYFFTHVLHGVMFYLPLYWLSRTRVAEKAMTRPVRFWAAVLIEAAWEVMENSPIVIDRYREATISLGYYGDSIANSMIDILACTAGYWITSRIKVWQSLTLFFGTELILAILIRDGLLLNILMLLVPIDAVLQWQMGA